MGTQPNAAPGATTRERSLLDDIAEHQANVASRYMPTLTIDQFKAREKSLDDIRQLLLEEVDYGTIPGTNKPTLLLPGAQKVCAYFGYVPRYTFTEKVEDWTGERFGEPLFYYQLKCELEKDGSRVGEGVGAASSWESKYRYRWMQSPPPSVDTKTLVTRDATLYEPAFAISKKETVGKYGKPPAYWEKWEAAIADGTAVEDNRRKTKDDKPMKGYRMGGVEYRAPNADFADTINTVLKMSKKRAYVDATLSATGLTQYFTQDVEDIPLPDTGPHKAGTQAAADYVAEQKFEQAKAADKLQLPAQLKPYISPTETGWFTRAFKFIQGELIKVGGPDWDRIAVERGKTFVASGQMKEAGKPTEFLLGLWGDVERLRAEKAQAEAASAESAFSVG